MPEMYLGVSDSLHQVHHWHIQTSSKEAAITCKYVPVNMCIYYSWYRNGYWYCSGPEQCHLVQSRNIFCSGAGPCEAFSL